MYNNLLKCFCRRLSQSTVTQVPWLSKPLKPHIVNKTTSHIPLASKEGKTHVTKLSNGLRVASVEGQGEFCTIGVAIKAGSRYEMFSPTGVTHFLEKLGFNSTESYSSKDHILHALEEHGGICDCQFSRDVSFYALSLLRKSLETGVNLLGEVTLLPQLLESEIDLARSLVDFDLQDQEESLVRLQPDILLHDLCHRASFRGNAIGLPKFCTRENISTITRDDLASFLNTLFQPDRMVISGVNVDHDSLCQLVEDNFNFSKRSFSSAKSLRIDDSVSQFSGGELKVEKVLTPVTGGDNPLPELTHVMVGMESVAATHEDFVPVNVLGFLLGGGSSFSAGGPGKGMYSRMYLNVLNRYHFVNHASVQVFPYYDSGLFALQLSSPPADIKETCRVAVKELLSTTASKLEPEELTRAKNQLKSRMLENLETKPVQMEDIARQVLGHGERTEPETLVEMIDAVSKDDVLRVAHDLMASKVGVASLGKTENVPSARDLIHALINDAKWPDERKIKLF